MATQTEQLVLIGILLVLMVFIVFFELKVMRRKSKEVRAASQKKDEAFNSVLTTRTVLNIVRDRGGRVGDAPALLDRAKDYLNRGNYDACIGYCEKARSELTAAMPARKLPSEDTDSDAKVRLEAVAESILSSRPAPAEADSYAGTKLDSPGEGNYLGAKFEMSAAKADIRRSIEAGRSTAVADSFMVDAETAYTAGDYDKAMSMAVKARRSLGKGAGDDSISLRQSEEAKPVREPKVFEVEDEVQKAPSGKICKDCGAELDNNDMFCPVCGAKVQAQTCPSCGAKPRPDDKFCRKCGHQIG